ncbi:hypothetical protein [Bythopirellula polymerisocia]|uniref:Uncharacterized protein n=1 Tax=Bythopirellula polymerisocia TaxID=2528003 RepID=A0A5C6CX12_9BACT|nr:hypothetical protein [Bythopirellula polymerisocia]TWU27556.1 hypothetical protein Pla144_23330 [Bythopirellula polymerisocia]
MGKVSREQDAVGCTVVCVLGFFFLVSVLSSRNGGANYQNEAGILGAHENGSVAGVKDGTKAGVVARLEDAEDEGYWNAVAKVKASRDYVLMPHYCLAIALTAFAIGFFGQFSLFYALRRFGILADIDLILLPKSSRVVKLRINE